MNKNKQLVVNILASFLAYAVTFGINFLLSPYIVKNIGVEAYGFVGLANNFISYAGLITVALNSLAGRFVTIKIYENDIDSANRYFSSVFISNIILTMVMGLIAAVVIVFLDKLITVPQNIYWDVIFLFISLFVNCMLGTAFSIFTVATFATNKLYLNSLRQIESNVIRVIFIAGLFLMLEPKVSYIGITTLAAGIYVVAFNIYYTKKLTPYIHIKRSFFDIKAIRELLSSGIWNLINRLGVLLLEGLDLLITNLFINASAMGVLSIAKIIPNAIAGIIGTLVGVFSPNFTILYAQKKYDELLQAVKQSMKIMGIITNIPIVVLIVCGEYFFSMWQPTQNAWQLHMLSILTCASFIFNGGINCLYNIFTVVNKLKVNAIAVCTTGILSTGLVFVMLKVTDLGIYAVAGVSTALAIIRNLVFTVPYGAYCLKQKWYTFYSEVARTVIFVLLSCTVGYVIKNFITLDGWKGLILLGIVTLIESMILGLFVILRKSDRMYLKHRLLRR